jgi:hypothetical protein
MENFSQLPAVIQKENFRSIFFSKIISHLKNHTMRQLLKQLLLAFGGIITGALLVAPTQTIAVLEYVFTTHEYIASKIALVALGFIYRKTVIRFFRRVQKLSHKRQIMQDQEKLIDGIPVSELADYLIRNGNFKREGINGVRATFGIYNMDRFNRLANNLEQRKILKRGENNMRVLEGTWSRQALVDFLSQSEDSGKEMQYFRVHRVGDNAKVRLNKEEILV